MRHNKKFNHLGRTSSHRRAMLANMASSLIENKRISTTVAKAKALRTYVEPLITKAKNDTTHSRRVVFSHLQNKDAVSELFRDVAVKIAERPGGYTRILRTGSRLGDNAEMCIIELVDYNETMLVTTEEAAKPKRRRTRRAGSKQTGAAVAEGAKQTGTKKKENSAPEEVKEDEKDQPENVQTESDSEGDNKSVASEEKTEVEDVKPAEETSEEKENPASDEDEKR